MDASIRTFRTLSSTVGVVTGWWIKYLKRKNTLTIDQFDTLVGINCHHDPLVA